MHTNWFLPFSHIWNFKLDQMFFCNGYGADFICLHTENEKSWKIENFFDEDVWLTVWRIIFLFQFTVHQKIPISDWIHHDSSRTKQK